MDQQAAPLRPHGREDSAIHPHDAEHVHIEHLLKLFRGEPLSDAEPGIPGVVDDDVQPSPFAERRIDRTLYRVLAGNVELEHAEAKLFGLRDALERGAMLGVASIHVSHGGEHMTAPAGKSFRRIAPESCAGSRDQDRRGHTSSAEWK